MRHAILLSVAAATVMAGGYKIPESSINATALSAAYVANAHGADAAYYNPAAMVHNEDVNLFEADMTYIGLSKVNYQGGYVSPLTGTTTGLDIDSKAENFLVPSLHYTSKKLGDMNLRAGLSVVVPAGLSKRWTTPPARASAEEFTLETVELNPSIALPLDAKTSIAVGLRIVKTDGVVKSNAAPAPVSRNMTGNSIDGGYNLALHYKPNNQLALAATYRSKIDLTVEGDAVLQYLATPYIGSASVTIPTPAALNLAAAYTFEGGTTVEAVYERTYWSAYKNLDFDYGGTPNAATGVFGAPIPKNWNDTNTYRLGVTQKLDQWTLMGGIAYDETPVPETTLGFELPDSDAWMVSFGGRYQLNDQMNIGLACLVDMKKDRVVNQTGTTSINGEFSNARAYLVTAGIEYRF